MADRPKQASCYPSAELYEQIEELAEEREISTSQFLIEAARKEVQRSELE